MGKHQRRRIREQGPQEQQDPQQGNPPAVTVTAGAASAESSVPGPEEQD